MSYSRDSQVAILQVARATWPDLVRFYEDFTAERMNWRQLMQSFEESDGATGLAHQYGVAVWFPLTPSEDFGFASEAYTGRCDLFYITRTVTIAGIERQVKEIRGELETAASDMTAALRELSGDVQVMDCTIDTSPASVANGYFLEKKIPLAAAMVSATYCTGSAV